MGRRHRNSVVPYVVLGAAVSIGVVALTASRFGWRRTKTDPELPAAAAEELTAPASDESADDTAAEATRSRFVPAVRWDAPPEEYAAAVRASGDPPAP
jgi:hypothetical protein